MATAKRTVEKVEVKTFVEQERVTLVLTLEEARAVLYTLGSIAGTIQGSIREYVSPVYAAIKDAGVTYNFYQHPFAADGWQLVAAPGSKSMCEQGYKPTL